MCNPVAESKTYLEALRMTLSIYVQSFSLVSRGRNISKTHTYTHTNEHPLSPPFPPTPIHTHKRKEKSNKVGENEEAEWQPRVLCPTVKVVR